MVYGWGRQTIEDQGGVLSGKCTRCGNLVEWRLVNRLVWFTLFFIPLFPYSNQYWLICPICSWGFRLSKEGATYFRALTEHWDFMPQKPKSFLYADPKAKERQELLSCTTCVFCNQKDAEMGLPWCTAPNPPDIKEDYCYTFTPKA
jgi:hypothetical protein